MSTANTIASPPQAALLRGKTILAQPQLRELFKEAPHRLLKGKVRSFVPFSDSERLFFQVHGESWCDAKYCAKMMGPDMETDNASHRRHLRRVQQQVTRSAREAFVAFGKQHQILHTTDEGVTTAPCASLQNMVSLKGRRAMDMYDRGDRVLWQLDNGHIMCVTKRNLLYLQEESRSGMVAALRTCRETCPTTSFARVAGGTGGSALPATKTVVAEARTKRARVEMHGGGAAVAFVKRLTACKRLSLSDCLGM
jgi:hypothetical protein